jgi:hypothetical protein
VDLIRESWGTNFAAGADAVGRGSSRREVEPPAAACGPTIESC